jgi:hypothetical protein
VAAAGPLGITPPTSLENDYESAKDDLGPIQAAADRELETIGAIAEADRRVRAPRDVWMQLGLLGELEPMTRVEAAKTAFNADQMPAAMTAAAEARTLLDRAGDEGRNRVAVGMQLTVLVVLIVAAIVIWRVRRRRRVAAAAARDVAAYTGTSETWTPPPSGWRPSPTTWTPTPERPPDAQRSGAEPGGAYGTLPANLSGEPGSPPPTPAATPPEAEPGDDD